PTLFVLTATATPRTAPLSLHDALPISGAGRSLPRDPGRLPAILLRLDQPVTLGASTEEIGKVKANEGSEPRACKPDLIHRRGITHPAPRILLVVLLGLLSLSVTCWAAAPQVVATVPELGAGAVDPQSSEIRVTFDQP